LLGAKSKPTNAAKYGLNVTARKRTIQLVNSVDRPLGEAQVVEATLAFANGCGLRIVGQGSQPGPAAVQVLQSLPSDRAHGAEARAWEHIFALVQGAHTNPKQCAHAYLQTDLQGDGGGGPRRLVKRVPGGLAVLYHERFGSILELATLGALLLLDPSRPFLRKLCRCEFDKCRDYFLKKPPDPDRMSTNRGRPKSKYCCTRHANEAHDADAAKRAQAYRKRKAEAANDRTRPRKPK
jgi:hypothetical protein